MQAISMSRTLAVVQEDTFSCPIIQLTRQQWSYPQYYTSCQKCDVIGGRSQIGSSVYLRTQGNLHAAHPQRNGTPAISNADTNGQLNSRRGNQQQNTTQANESYGYVIPLVARPRDTETITYLLEGSQTEPWRLQNQTSLSEASQRCETRVPDPTG